MKPEAGAGDRIETMDALRGIAALMVVLWHVFDPQVRYFHSDMLHAVLGGIASQGNMGVYMFFAISGFVIPLAAVGGGRLVAYWRALAKRMTRLYPPFVASLVFTALVLLGAQFVPGFAGTPVSIHSADVAANATYLAPFLDRPWLNPVYWTLLIEVQYYLLIYLLLRHFDAFTGRQLLAGTALVSLVPLALSSYAVIADFTDCFALGFISFLLFDGRVQRRDALIAGIIPLAVIFFDKGSVTFVLVATTALLCARRGPAPRLLVALGTISYSLYLTHYFVGTKAVRLLLRFLPDNDPGVGAAHLLAVLACLIVATLFYFAAERPAIAWSHRISARRARAADEPATAGSAAR